MDARQRNARFLVHADNLVKHNGIELIDTGKVRIQHVVRKVLGRPVMGRIGRVLQAETLVSGALLIMLHGLDGGTGVARGVKFRHHLDAALPGIFQDFLVFLFRKESGVAEAAVGGRFEGFRLLQVPVRHLVMAAEGRQVRKLGDFQAPGLVVSQMEMQEVQLVGGHDVQHLENLLLAAEIPHYIQHEAAEAQVRPVFDDQVFGVFRQFGKGGPGKESTGFIL